MDVTISWLFRSKGKWMSGQPEDEHVLLMKAQQGDADAFGGLYERYAQAVYRYINAHLGDQMDVEDLTNDVFFKAWHSLPRYHERGVPFLAFLFRIARNRLIDHYRQQHPQSTFSEALENTHADNNPGPAETLLEEAGHQELALVLSQIREDYRTVLVLRFINQLSPKETAEIMKRSIGAVRVLQHRALESLREVVNLRENESL
jgi:RNA polymerase sigma-70 factor (ECF subfamily)